MTDLHAAAERLRQIHKGTPELLVYPDVIDPANRNDPYVADVRACLGHYLAILSDPTSLLKRQEWREWKCGDCQWSTGGNGTYHTVKSEDGHWRAYLYFGTVMGVRECCESKEDAQAACWADYCARMRGAFISQK